MDFYYYWSDYSQTPHWLEVCINCCIYCIHYSTLLCTLHMSILITLLAIFMVSILIGIFSANWFIIILSLVGTAYMVLIINIIMIQENNNVFQKIEKEAEGEE